MRTFIHHIVFTAILLLCVLSVHADNPPGPPTGHGSSNDESPTGGGAPIGEGVGMLVLLAGVYGGTKYLFHRNQEEL